MSRLTCISACLLVLAACCPARVSAQTTDGSPARHTVFLELGGNALVYSVNYDFRFARDFSIRMGGFYVPPRGDDYGAYGGPVLVNLILARGSHHVEIGAGSIVIASFDRPRCEQFRSCASERLHVGATGVLGYRYQPYGGGLFLKVSYNPLYSWDDGFGHWAGISVGVTL